MEQFLLSFCFIKGTIRLLIYSLCNIFSVSGHKTSDINSIILELTAVSGGLGDGEEEDVFDDHAVVEGESRPVAILLQILHPRDPVVHNECVAEHVGKQIQQVIRD